MCWPTPFERRHLASAAVLGWGKRARSEGDGKSGQDRAFDVPAGAMNPTAVLTYNEEMEQVTKSEPLEQVETPAQARPLVFLDTNVILEYLQGDLRAAQLFSAEAKGRIRLAINPIVLQELLLAADAADRPEFEQIRDHLRVLPVDFAKAEALLPGVRALRNRLAHPNDILILSSADECDFLVTRDARMKKLVTAGRPLVVTPEELVVRLRAA